MLSMQNFKRIDYFDSQKPLCGVYIISHPTSGKFYVGSSRNLYARKIHHLSELNLRKHGNRNLQEAFNISPFINFLYFLTDDYINEEQKILNEYSAAGILFNIATDALYSFKNQIITEETKQKMREAALKKEPYWEHLKKLHQSNIGSKRTEEQKQNISKMLIGKPLSELHRQSIIRAHEKYCKAVVIDGIEYSSLKTAAQAHNVSYVTVRNRANDEKFSDWKWK